MPSWIEGFWGKLHYVLTWNDIYRQRLTGLSGMRDWLLHSRIQFYGMPQLPIRLFHGQRGIGRLRRLWFRDHGGRQWFYCLRPVLCGYGIGRFGRLELRFVLARLFLPRPRCDKLHFLRRGHLPRPNRHFKLRQLCCGDVLCRQQCFSLHYVQPGNYFTWERLTELCELPCWNIFRRSRWSSLLILHCGEL